MSKEIFETEEGPRPKRLKTEDEKFTAIPQLNEDIFGRILKFVVEGNQRQILDVVYSEECGVVGGDVLIDEGIDGKEYEPISNEDAVDFRIVKWPQALKNNSHRLIFHNNVKMLPSVTLGYAIWECDPYEKRPEFFPHPLPKNPDQFVGVLKHFGKFYVQVFPCRNHHTMMLDKFKSTITSRNEINELMHYHKRCGWRCFDDIREAGYNPFSGSPYYSPICYSPGGTLIDKPKTPEQGSDSDGEVECVTQ